MNFSETHMQFFQVLERLKKIEWGAQFRVLKPPEFCALRVIYNHHQEHPEVPGIYVSAFAEKLHVAAPAASKLLKHMEEQGWLVRMVDPNNRRNTFIVMTEGGERLFLEEQENGAAVANRLFQRMGKENVAALLASVNHMLDLVEEEFEKKNG